VDAEILEIPHAHVYGGSGDASREMKVATRELVGLTRGEVADVKRRRAADDEETTTTTNASASVRRVLSHTGPHTTASAW
jgi:hypothetical protein